MPERLTLGWMVLIADSDRGIAMRVAQLGAQRAVDRLRRRFCIQDADAVDLASDLLLLTVKSDFAALRRGRANTSFAAWLIESAKNLIRREWTAKKRRRWIALGSIVEPSSLDPKGNSEREDASGATPDATEIVAAVLHGLSEQQRRIVQTWLDEGSEYAAGRALGLTRDHVHDVLRRALRRLRRRKPWNAADADRHWAVDAAEQSTNAVDAELLRLYAAGRSRGEIAAALHVSKNSVRCRLHRARKAIARETPPPPIHRITLRSPVGVPFRISSCAPRGKEVVVRELKWVVWAAVAIGSLALAGAVSYGCVLPGPPPGQGALSDRAFSIVFESNSVIISTTTPSSNDDNSIHIDYMWDAGEPRCGTGEGKGGAKKTNGSVSVPIPGESTTLTYLISFDQLVDNPQLPGKKMEKIVYSFKGTVQRP
jgi:DNA-directed RNA polymerase specialized sigma24 family protein